MYCQTVSTGLSSGDLDGSGRSVMLSGTFSLGERCHPVMARCDGQADLLQMKGHRLGRAAGQDEPGGLALSGTDRTEDVGRLGPLIARGRGTGPAWGPAAGDLVLLPDPSLVAEPDLYRAAACRGGDLLQAGRELFLKMSAAASLLA